MRYIFNDQSIHNIIHKKSPRSFNDFPLWVSNAVALHTRFTSFQNLDLNLAEEEMLVHWASWIPIARRSTLGWALSESINDINHVNVY